jgi:hypothetical protein
VASPEQSKKGEGTKRTGFRTGTTGVLIYANRDVQQKIDTPIYGSG